MNKADTILPSSIAMYPHLLAYDLAFKKQVDKMPLEVLLVYLVDQVPADALPVLAEQFDVLGYKGWKLTTTEAERRNLIKSAIKLHRYKGTPYAIKEALKAIGFNNVEIIEHVNSHWAKFTVKIDTSEKQVDTEAYQAIIAMIKEYKNARSKLEAIQVNLDITDDEIEIEEESAGAILQLGVDDIIYITGNLFYDGLGDYDGSSDHSGDADLVEFV